jgi:uncharacterized repeat protein (TIGR01451 family)
VYGAAEPALTYTASGTLYYDDTYAVISGVVLSAPTGAAATVGTHVIDASGGVAANYEVTAVDGTLTVNRAALTVTADDKQRLSGEANPPLTATISGFVNGETLPTSGVTGSPALNTTATPSSPVGTYPITVSQGTLAASNYEFTAFVSGTLTVSPVSGNPPQITSADAASVPENSTAVMTVTATDPDLPPQTLTFSITGSGPDDSLFQITSGGALSFWAAPDYENPIDTGGTPNDNVYVVQVQVSDGLLTDTQDISVTVTPVNDNAPVAYDDSLTVTEAGTGTTMDVRANDTDADLPYDTLTVTGHTAAAHGTVVNNGNGTFTYTHDGSENFSDSFAYTVSDAVGHTATATVEITVTPVNDNAPAANGDSLTVAEGGAGVTVDVRDNDTDADLPYDALMVTGYTPPAHGTVVANGDGTFTYMHDGSENFSDSFSYTVSDAAMPAHTAIATVLITITPMNDAPVNAVPGLQVTPKNTALVFAPAQANPLSVSDVDAGSAPVQVTLNVTNGTLTLGSPAGLTFSTGDGTGDPNMIFTGTISAINTALNGLTYSPTNGFVGTDTLVMTTNDLGNTGSGGAQSDTHMIAITVGALEADLAITMIDSPDPVAVGDPLIYIITVSNSGPAGATNVVVTDDLPAGVTFLGASTAYTLVGNGVMLQLGDIADGASATAIVTVQPTAVGTLNNTATVSATQPVDPRTNNNSASVRTTVAPAQADLSIQMASTPNKAFTGMPLTYQITVNNAGPANAANVVVTDTLPGSVTFVSASVSQGSWSRSGSTVTFNLGSLASGMSASATIVVTPTVAGKITNIASVTASQTDPKSNNNTASVSTNVQTPKKLQVHPVDHSASTEQTGLTPQQLQPVIGESVARWQAAGLASQRLAALGAIEVVVADLPDTALGFAAPGAVWIDRDAAGYGWFIDATPAAAGPVPAGHVDLLSVVTHELGHVLGFEHDVWGDVMDARLLPGERPGLRAVAEPLSVYDRRADFGTAFGFGNLVDGSGALDKVRPSSDGALLSVLDERLSGPSLSGEASFDFGWLVPEGQAIASRRRSARDGFFAALEESGKPDDDSGLGALDTEVEEVVDFLCTSRT